MRDKVNVKEMWPGMYGGLYKQTYRRVQCRCGQWIKNYSQMKHIYGYNHAFNMMQLQKAGKLPPPIVKVPFIPDIDILYPNK
jgi:hypothetical protein